MKKLFFLLVISTTLFAACHKQNSCTQVTITQSGMPCSQWGIRVNNHTYPSNSIPVSFQREGLVVCTEYELYEDPRACACCGGTWAKINSMRNRDE
ncbi:MAG: hypothetical protein Q8941_05535 [Bacteroidota bacterium]|nr:hypothetical protein [Bacteroidota bacterium]